MRQQQEQKAGNFLEFELDPSLLVHYKTLTQLFDESYDRAITDYLAILKQSERLKDIRYSNCDNALTKGKINFGCDENDIALIRNHLRLKGINDFNDQDFMFFLWSEHGFKMPKFIISMVSAIYKSIAERFSPDIRVKDDIHPNGIIERVEQETVVIHIAAGIGRIPDKELEEKYEIDILVDLESKTISFTRAKLFINQEDILEHSLSRDLKDFKEENSVYLIQTPEMKQAKLEIAKVKLKIAEIDQTLVEEFEGAAYLRMTALPTGSTPNENRPETLYQEIAEEIGRRSDILISKQDLLDIFSFLRPEKNEQLKPQLQKKPSKWRYLLFGGLLLLGIAAGGGALLSGFGIIPLVLSSWWIYGLSGGGGLSALFGLTGIVTTCKKRSEAKQTHQATSSENHPAPYGSTAQHMDPIINGDKKELEPIELPKLNTTTPAITSKHNNRANKARNHRQRVMKR